MKDLNQNEIFSWFYLKTGNKKKLISQGIINGKKMADRIFKKRRTMQPVMNATSFF